MLNKGLDAEIKKCLPKPVYFICSEENFFLEEVLAKAVEVVLASHIKEFNYNVFYPPTQPNEILDAAWTVPFMAARRLIVIKDFHQFKFTESDIKAMDSYFNKPCESTCMLILSQKAPKARLEALSVFQLKMKDSDVPAWIKQKAHEKGINITQSAVDYLIELVGTDIGLLTAEIEKFSLSGIKTLDSKEILSLTGTMREYTAFNLVDAIIAGRKAKAFRILKALSSKPEAVLGALNWHYKQFYTLWEEKGRRPGKMPDTKYRMLLKYLASYTEDDFYHIFRNLHEADIGIKTSGKSELALEFLLIKLLQ